MFKSDSFVGGDPYSTSLNKNETARRNLLVWYTLILNTLTLSDSQENKVIISHLQSAFLQTRAYILEQKQGAHSSATMNVAAIFIQICGSTFFSGVYQQPMIHYSTKREAMEDLKTQVPVNMNTALAMETITEMSDRLDSPYLTADDFLAFTEQ